MGDELCAAFIKETHEFSLSLKREKERGGGEQVGP